MTKDILLSISGIHLPEGEKEQEELEIITAGTYYEKNGKRYIKYDEVQEGSDETVRNLLKIGEGSLELTRRGLTSTHMIFEKDKKSESYYDTPFGRFLIGVSATQLEVIEKEKSLDVKVSYALEINNQYISDCNIRISAREI